MKKSTILAAKYDGLREEANETIKNLLSKFNNNSCDLCLHHYGTQYDYIEEDEDLDELDTIMVFNNGTYWDVKVLEINKDGFSGLLTDNGNDDYDCFEYNEIVHFYDLITIIQNIEDVLIDTKQ